MKKKKKKKKKRRESVLPMAMGWWTRTNLCAAP